MQCGLKMVDEELGKCHLKYNSSNWHVDTRCYYKILIKSLMSQVSTKRLLVSNGVVAELIETLSHHALQLFM